MPSNLKFFRRDPQRGQNRGQGYYYTRHYNGGQWWSKFTEEEDGAKWHDRTPVGKGGVKKAEMERPHLADYKTRKKRGRPDMNKKTTRAGTGGRGYF